MPQRGYYVAPDLWDDLREELERVGVKWFLVPSGEMATLGGDPRPVIVSEGPVPSGWTRYKRCRECGKGVGLTTDGMVRSGCARCPEKRIQDYWERLENRVPVSELQLPAWIDRLGAKTVADVRSGVSRGELSGVGAERTHIVAEALRVWREHALRIMIETINK